MKPSLQQLQFSLFSLLFLIVFAAMGQNEEDSKLPTVIEAPDEIHGFDDFDLLDDGLKKENKTTGEEEDMDGSGWDDVRRTSDAAKEKSTQYKRKNHRFKGVGRRVGAMCMDDSMQEEGGRGACSGHGGVRFWLYEKEDGTIERIATQRHLDHPESLDDEEMSYLAAVNEERKENLKNNNGVLQLNTFYQLMTIFVVCVMTVFTIQKIVQGGRFPF
ncbi:MAG: hypothetical protein ACPGVB_13960 [Chitinophagales bacterium]